MDNGFDTLAVILTAVEVETDSIRKSFPGWRRVNVSGDAQRYDQTTITRGDGSSAHIITTQQRVMGMTASTLLAFKSIVLFRPKYLIMSGIAAGTSDDVEQMYGDVIVPDVIWDYTTGKYVGKDETEIRFGDVGFLPRPMSIETDPELLQKVRDTMHSEDNEYHVHVGPMACGSCVVANGEVVEKRIKPLFPRTVGLDMESYGVYYAAQNAPQPRPIPFVAKSICDFANSLKDDRFQRFAAYNSANYIKYMLENHL